MKKPKRWPQPKQLKATVSLGNALERYVKMNQASGFNKRQSQEFTYAFCKGYLDQ